MNTLKGRFSAAKTANAEPIKRPRSNVHAGQRGRLNLRLPVDLLEDIEVVANLRDVTKNDLAGDLLAAGVAGALADLDSDAVHAERERIRAQRQGG